MADVLAAFPDIPVFQTSMLSGEEFFLLGERQLFGSPLAIRLLLLWTFSAGWPMRDAAAAEEDG